MYVIATAGHVDHGKSTLVNALTAMDPDRWKEEKQRGLTIDLGFAWTTLESGANVAFVDVPGHERFIANTLAGLGPAPAVLLVVAADEGWNEQTSEHLEAIDALGISRGIIVLSRIDNGQSFTEQQVREYIAGTSLADAPVYTVSAHTGEGMSQLRAAIDDILPRSSELVAAADHPLRMWIDRAFSLKGAGTVVTGTWASGRIKVGDSLRLLTNNGVHEVIVRGLHSENTTIEHAEPVMRLAVNLRGINADTVSRGDVLTSAKGTWWRPEILDVRRRTGPQLDSVPKELTIHIGTAAVPVHVRPLGAEHARLTMQSSALPLRIGDRLVLRGPGLQTLAGVEVLDLDPPAVRRRGAPAQRTEELTRLDPYDAGSYVARRAAVEKCELSSAGFDLALKPVGVVEFQSWWIDALAIGRWKKQLREMFDDYMSRNSLADALPLATALSALGLPADALLAVPLAGAGLKRDGAFIRDPHAAPRDLGSAEKSVAQLEAQLKDNPFSAPDAATLDALCLGASELAAAERAGRLLRIGTIVLLPSAPQKAAEILKKLPGEFKLSEARQVLGTTRRIAVPLLEYMDSQGLSKRVSDTTRVIN